MKKEWFEPGPDGESPFEREYYNHRESGTIAGNAIAAAFRALLAEEDGGRTAHAKDAEIAELRESLERSRLALNTTRQQRDQFWSQRDAARAEVDRWKSIAEAHEQNYRAMLRRVDEVVAERNELEMEKSLGWHEYDELKSRYDALRARINAQPVDERKGEEVVNSTGIQYRGHWLPFHDRRRTAGTIADRGKV